MLTKTVHQNGFFNFKNWHEKLSEPWFNLTGLKIVDGCHGSCRFSDSEFFFWVLTELQLNHWWSFNLRHWDRTIICSYSSFQSSSPSLSAFLPTAVFAFFLSLRFFRLLFLQFFPFCVFPLNSRVFWSLWRWLTTCILSPIKYKLSTTSLLGKNCKIES